MCGIFGYVGKKKAALIILDGLKRLEYRGYDSWGIAVGQETFAVEKHVGKIGEAVTVLPKSGIGIGHTRWATHGGVTERNAHPQLDCTRTVALVHNGIIENYEVLKKKLLQKGHTFLSETDTEVMVHLIEEKMHRPFVDAVLRCFQELEGLNAIVAVHAKEKVIVAVKNGSPLVVGFGDSESFIASDAASLLQHTKRVIFLEDHEAAVLTEDAVKIIDVKSGHVLKKKPTSLTWKFEETTRGNYPHFMLKEIYDQPGMLSDIARRSRNDIRKVAHLIKTSYGTFMVACGSASYAALSGQYFFSRVAHRHVNPSIGSEFVYHADFLTPRSLVIALSQSGETIDVIESVKLAKSKGARVIALVNVLGSTLYRMADTNVLLRAGVEKGVCATKSFTAKLAVLILLSYMMDGRYQEGQKILLKTSEAVDELLHSPLPDQLKRLAHALRGVRHMYIIGRGQSYPISLEAALKVKEVSYIHAEGFAAGELKHGVIALIEKGTTCLVFAPNDETYGAVLSGAMELKARGGYIIGVTSEKSEVFDDRIEIPDLTDGSSILQTVVAQLFAYYLALEKGYDPDKPRNLAKSVTVK
ncbi:MAG TPA: glutamine--fructose-6-phosphate transaminase (isomerizing) [Patescibacteria group bacterium]|nr:glutamine--fructose-6-phosphate transaminase (isomerizing) [Patescibacteria group bacterium]